MAIDEMELPVEPQSLKRSLHLFSPAQDQYAPPDPQSKRIRTSYKEHAEYGQKEVISPTEDSEAVLALPGPPEGSGDVNSGAHNALVVPPPPIQLPTRPIETGRSTSGALAETSSVEEVRTTEMELQLHVTKENNSRSINPTLEIKINSVCINQQSPPINGGNFGDQNMRSVEDVIKNTRNMAPVAERISHLLDYFGVPRTSHDQIIDENIESGEDVIEDMRNMATVAQSINELLHGLGVPTSKHDEIIDDVSAVVTQHLVEPPQKQVSFTVVADVVVRQVGMEDEEEEEEYEGSEYEMDVESDDEDDSRRGNSNGVPGHPLDGLRKEIYSGHEDGEAYGCSICMEILACESEVSTCPCDHTYHSRCLRDWLSVNNSCPVCRR